MQTFLPLDSYRDSARVLDWSRLNNQLNECFVLYTSIGDIRPAWHYHPCRLMWVPYKLSLLSYAWFIADEIARRGEHNVLIEYFADELRMKMPTPGATHDLSGFPVFMGDERLHSSHRAALLYKDPLFYGQYGWKESPRIEYFWPVTSKDRAIVTVDDPRYEVYKGIRL